jgi:hypothetical protein
MWQSPYLPAIIVGKLCYWQKRMERIMQELNIQAVAKNQLNRDFRPEKPKGIFLSTLKFFTIEKDYIPLLGITLQRNMKH